LPGGVFLARRGGGLGGGGGAGGPPPRDTLRVALIGCGVRGRYLIGNLPESARVVALCDCARSRIAETLEPRGEFVRVLAAFRDTDAAKCTTYQDYRRMLEREKLDAVLIATPDHHHVLPAMLALQAGLHVYLEKPLSLTIREGRQLVVVVRQSGRVLQVGSQQRTMELNRFACDFVRRGGLGRVSRVELPNYPGPLPAPTLPAEAIPPDLDWDLFCGPAELRPYHRRLWVKDEFRVGELLWRGWDLFRDYSGHMMTNWGAHSVDMVQLALGRDDTGPVVIEVSRPGSIEAAWKPWSSKTPAPVGAEERRFWPVTMRYADGVELHFSLSADMIVFHGDKGRLRMRRNWFETDPPDLVRDGPDPKLAERWRGPGHVARPHLENWLDSIRQGMPPNAPVEAGHRTATICHLANLARELGRPVRWDPARERFVNDEEADQLLERPRRRGFELPL
ncbi:MAG: Gfo/Idh/MocA family oxidoreductase, partial [Gemmataceae bacterium]|nr:Gfo/Idh/MocA family oxidoreductase [Gemmataceae bacterium]